MAAKEQYMSEANAAVATSDVAEQQQTQVNPEESTTAKAQSAGGEGEPTGDANSGDTEKKRLGGWQRKIQKLEQENAYKDELLRRALAHQAPAQQQTEPTKPQAEAKPKQEDFATLAEYLDARDEWATKEARRIAREEYEATKKAEQEQSEKQKTAQTWKEKCDAARGKYEDFDDVAFFFDLSPAMEKVILKSEVGADLAYYLGQNKEEAAQIAKMDALDAAAALGEIKARIAQEKSKPADEVPPEPVVSKAPKPPTPVSKSGAAPAITDPMDAAMKGDYATYERLMEQRERQRKGR